MFMTGTDRQRALRLWADNLIYECYLSCRLTSLSSLTLQTAYHNSLQLQTIGALRWHPSLVQLTLSQQAPPELYNEPLPHRLTSLRMHACGEPFYPLPVCKMLDGARRTVSRELASCCGMPWPCPILPDAAASLAARLLILQPS